MASSAGFSLSYSARRGTRNATHAITRTGSNMRLPVVVALLIAGATISGQQPSSQVDPLHRPFDEILDIYVRDGFVYYNALRLERAKFDQYVAALNGATATAHATGTREQQLAFWINAYNAFVLRTVIDRFPIRGKASAYPTSSIRQIPGAFERLTHRAAGRTVTLDGIEKDILTPLGDARAFLALGRGSVGGGRLRSEAYDASRIDQQLDAVAAESLTRKEVVRIDAVENRLIVSALFSWREPAFVASFADKAADIFRERSPLERAVLALIEPHLVGAEAEFLEKNTFSMVFDTFDWRLNDLSARSQ
jgi:hypothetical protein